MLVNLKDGISKCLILKNNKEVLATLHISLRNNKINNKEVLATLHISLRNNKITILPTLGKGQSVEVLIL